MRHQPVQRQVERALDAVRILDALEQVATQEHDAGAKDQPEEHGGRQDQHLLRLDRRARTQRRIDQVDVAARAGLLHRQFLHAVQQQHVDVLGDLRVALELDGLHLGRRQAAEAVAELVLFALQLRELLLRGDHHRVRIGEALRERRELQALRGDLLLVLHAAFEVDLRLVARVDRARRALVLRERGLRAFEVGLQARLLALQEVEHLGRFGLLRDHVLVQVRLRERVRDRGGLVRVLAFERDLHDAGLLALLAHLDTGLEPADRVEIVVANHRELRAGARDELLHEQRHAAALRRFADAARQQPRAVLVDQRIGAVRAGRQRQLLAFERRHDVDRVDVGDFAAPRIRFQAEPRPRRRARRREARGEAADHRQRLRRDREVQLELVDDRRDDAAALDDLDFRVGRRLLRAAVDRRARLRLRERLRRVVVALDPHVHVRLVDRLRDEAVEAGERDDRHRDAEQQPDVVHDDLEQLAEDDVLFLGLRGQVRVGVFRLRVHHSFPLEWCRGADATPAGYQRVICRM
ncbi:hypothetical protein BURCENBC7_AP3429 [Burkholderia cenocepacia BC7]|nr:hypothetical protein BURCENBC7_AP3429 [Burkholderia cenocepacia BC7]